ncbi:hypothetical protein BscR1v2_014130 [Bartonella schoenbuchensis R1]|uniref:Uncharacterized protein n=1 Tax=Bartonella schoenbuchensis (strain DSM 13525 / NCTC 13165 / R1) TaxID=687861 RepID=A0A1S6XRS0_BARSR|nr:hypothetical protein BscR1v2_014130 [Bartonella schoenbuchensis R1]
MRTLISPTHPSPHHQQLSPTSPPKHSSTTRTNAVPITQSIHRTPLVSTPHPHALPTILPSPLHQHSLFFSQNIPSSSLFQNLPFASTSPHNLAPLLARTSTSLAHPPQNLQHTNVKPTSPQTSTLKPPLKSPHPKNPHPLFLLHICLRNTFLLPSLSFILIEITSSSPPKTFFKCDCFLLIEEITN